jgi:hypothetical protein
MQEVDALQMETLLEPLRENRGFIAEAKKEVNDDRAPQTRKMDAIKSLFTGLEKDLDSLDVKTAAPLTAWETEKIRRARVASEEAEKKIKKANERVSIVATVKNTINSRFHTKQIETITAMSKAYHAKGADELNGYGVALQEWLPELDDEIYHAIIDGISISAINHTAAEVKDIINETAGGMKQTLDIEWPDKITAERDRLVLLIPSRITELQTVAPEVAAARVEMAHHEVLDSIIKDAQDKADVVSMEADNAKLSAVLDNAPVSVGVPTGRGVKVSKKYVITAHTAFPPIIANWVKNHLAKLTVEDATKKLSFMITAANDDLKKENITLVAAGLHTEEEVTVRKSRKNGAA